MVDFLSTHNQQPPSLNPMMMGFPPVYPPLQQPGLKQPPSPLLSPSKQTNDLKRQLAHNFDKEEKKRDLSQGVGKNLLGTVLKQ